MTTLLDMTEPRYIQLAEGLRIEPGPARRTAVATENLLRNDVTHPIYREGARDSLGKVIRIGERMDYLDWLQREGPYVWYVYHWRDGRYVEVSVQSSKEEAETAARRMAKED